VRKISLAGKAGIYVVHAALVCIVFLPLVFAFVSSLRPLEEVFKYVSPVGWSTFVPEHFTLAAYARLFTQWRFGSVLWNSLFVVAATVIFGVLVNSMAGLAFAKFEFRGKRPLYLLVLVSFMIPFELISIPLYPIVMKWGWINSYWALIVPTVANGVVIFLYRQFFLGIPDSLIEASMIDGFSWWGIYSRIIMPLAVPVSISAGLILFISQWESFLWPILVTRSMDFRTIQAALSDFQTEHATMWNDMFAASILAFMVPVAIIIPFQKYFIEGIAHTGAKE
jgi:multiple sugar transport system permease protein/putative chitobiose transport system permease protein